MWPYITVTRRPRRRKWPRPSAPWGARAALLPCDLDDADAVRALLPQAAAALGRVQCVVNNASLFDYDSATDFSPAKLDAHMRANVTAPILLAQALHAATPAGAQAVVINLLDQKLYNLNPDYLSYTLSKARAAHRHHHAGAAARADGAGWSAWRRGITLLSGDQTETGFANAHQQTPAGTFQHTGRCHRRRAVCGRRARRHRRHPAGSTAAST